MKRETEGIRSLFAFYAPERAVLHACPASCLTKLATRQMSFSRRAAL
ncbi:MAG: hypothetical protein J7641_23615 [Cyanobacteria bacterium SID2]|nr:hypothetical protein [Cyanobacteria bacterium SID2]MBP0005896.1 hypothetical protein [Cyanobacteria bacterium SBC]